MIGVLADVGALARSSGTSWSAVYPTGERVIAVAQNTLYTIGKESTDGGTTWNESSIAIPLAGTPDGGLLYLDENNAPHELRLLDASGARRVVGLVSLGGTVLDLPYGPNNGSIGGVDADGHAYLLCGAPYRQICRSDRPVTD